MNNATIIIQARTNSKRLPRKVLSIIQKKPLLWHVINRTKQVKGINQIIIATTKNVNDKILIQIAKKNSIKYFAGKTSDVLDRYFNCAKKYNADPIIRITSDCPLLDFKLVSQMLKFYNTHDYEYVSNTFPPTYPDGLDVEIFSFKILEYAQNNAKLKSEREHVTPFIRKNRKKIKIFNYENNVDYSFYRLTVDQKEDLKLIRKIYFAFKPNQLFVLNDILKFIKKNQEILKINSGIIRNSGYLKSIKNDSREKIIKN